MWSDKVELPATIDKAAADEAEIAIAQQESQPQARGLATAAACQTFWPSPHQVCGAILERYIQQGAQFGWMLLPTEGQALNPDGQGYRQRFMAGFIYWHPTTGAHAVNNYSAQVWERNGWETGWMGYPTGGEVPVTGSNPVDGERNGWVQTFQGGRVYRSPFSEGFQIASINGLILDRWLELGGPDSYLGFPIADEAVASDGVGRFSIFQHGAIYWHPETGAWEVLGEISEKWVAEGAYTGILGYPIDEPLYQGFGEYTQLFEGGVLYGIGTPGVDIGYSADGYDKIGPNYYQRVLPCLDYERSGSTLLGTFSVFQGPLTKPKIVTIDCGQFRNHIVSVANPTEGHFYNDPPTESDWYDFLSCTAHTLNGEPYYNVDTDKGYWGRQRYNTYTNTGSAVVVSSMNTVVTAWAGGPPKSGDWSACRSRLY
ncbi:LGFP repeat-containing protein [Corynebacterium glutamicum]|uniref:LGFP repeat-containing protein n=1 Tax=Corynebacterium glutamicum TaxID=1718 RepID=UPI0021B158CD|nr:hypothetical protein [Corynebacterium glutamicum]